MSKGFIKSVVAVLTGTLVAQVIPVIGTLVLARIFNPASFGLYSTWLGFVMFLGVVLTCRFEMALGVESDGQPRCWAALAIMKTIGITSLFTLLVLGVTMLLKLEFLDKFSLGLLVILIPAAALLAGTQTLQNWAAADGRYRHLSLMRISQAGSVVGFQIGFGLLTSNPFELACGYLAGTLVGLLVGLLLCPLKAGDSISIGSRESLTDFWRRQRRFPAFSLPADAVSAATAQLPIVIVAARFGSEAAGLLAMALRMVGAPMSLLSASVLDVFKRHSAQAYREKSECRAEYLHSLGLLFIVAAGASIAIALFAKPFFAKLFDASWSNAGIIALLLLPRFSIGFIASPLSYVVYIVGKQHIDLIWQLALLSMTLMALLLPSTFHAALLFFSVGYGLLYVVYLWMSYHFSCGKSA
jgi:O-antigen/teichoic acid export membrane protein